MHTFPIICYIRSKTINARCWGPVWQETYMYSFGSLVVRSNSLSFHRDLAIQGALARRLLVVASVC